MVLVCTLLAALLCSNAAALTLTTGRLDIAATSGAEPPLPGVFVLQLAPELLGEAHAAVAALGCCSSPPAFLPPSSLLVHFPSAYCRARAAALPHVTATAALPPHLKSLPSPAAAAPPLRALRLLLAAGGLEGLQAYLAPHLPALCPTCTLHAASSDGAHALLTSLSACGAGCTHASPAACGCAIAPALPALLSAYHALVFWEVDHAPAQAFNAFQREFTLTSDLLNSATIDKEFGACGETGACELSDFVPLSQTAAFFASLIPATLSTPPPTPLTPAAAAAAAAAGTDTASAVLVAEDFAAVAEQQGSIWAPLRARLGRGEGQGQCTLQCSGPACGQGFASCNDLETYVSAALSGAGQLVHVLDSGMDLGSPFFLDSRPAAATGLTPRRDLPFALSSHSHVAGYWSYVDALDDERGHGTHVAGSVSGAAVDPAITPADAAALQHLHGSAPRARILFTDASCTNAPGQDCAMAGQPYPWAGGFAPCPWGRAVCSPLDWNVSFGAPRAAGAFVSCNSWGSSGPSQYAANTAALDAWVSAHPDFLPIFAASNEGADGLLTLGTQATAKNVLTVGATQDGPAAHLAKIALLFQPSSARGCTSMLTGAVQQGILPSPPCPATPALLTPDACSRLADASQQRVLAVPPGRFNASGNIELALCCGCTPADVARGYAARASAGDGGAGASVFSTVLAYLALYQGRLRASFSSMGPTQDGRVKPDLAAPGFDTVSAGGRGSGVTRGTADPPPYGTFACATGDTTVGAVPWPEQTPVTFTAPPAGLEAVMATLIIDVIEPTRLINVSLPFQSLTAGTYSLEFYTNERVQRSIAPLMTPLRFTSAGTATPGTILFPFVNLQLAAGWAGFAFLRATAGAQLTAFSSAGAAQATCWGRVGTGFLLTLTTERGGGLGYAYSTSGTSMATPHVTGLAVLARQYYTGGLYPPSAGVGFTPSAALLKATLINSASPLINEALSTLLPNQFPPASASLLQASGGFGVPSLVRGLQFTALGSATSASRALPSLLLPGLTTAAGRGVDPALAHGAAHTYCVDVAPPPEGLMPAGAGLPLSLTLVWTDPPGNPLASWALVNNLDLSLLPPGGAFTIYGNNNASSPSQIPDGRNNVEKIELARPPPTLSAGGARITAPYAVTVRGAAVPLGPVQAYALVATGPGIALAAPGSCGPAPAPAPAAAAPALPTPAVAAIAVLALLVVGLGAALGVVLWRQRAGGGKQAAPPQAWGEAAAAGGGAAAVVKPNPLALNA